MAIRTWSRVLLAALGVAILAAASQLGVAFGLGIVRLSRTFPVDQENQWTAQMAWVTWFAMVAAVVGAVAADRMARRHGYEGGTGSRIAYSLCAGVGAAVLVPLCMQPARFAIVRATDPVLVIGLSATLGAVAGVFVALAALSHQPLMWNVGVVTGAAWAIALASVIPSLGPGDPLPNLRLGVLDLASFSTGAAQSSAVVTMPLLALALGAATAGLGRWLGRPPVTIAASGLIGPAMLCLAYLVAGPGSETDKFQAAPYWGALVAVGAGTLGSVLAAVARRPSFGGSATPAEEPTAATQTEQTAVAAPRPAGEPARIEPVFREPPTGEWSVSLPRHGADPSPAASTSASAADETTASLPTVGPSGGFFGESPASHEPAASHRPASHEPASRRPASHEPASHEPAGRRAASHEPVSHEPASRRPASHEPVSHEPASRRPAGHEPVSHEPGGGVGAGRFDEPTADLSPQATAAARPPRRSSGGRDPGAAGAVTAFSAGRRAAEYSTGEIPVYTDPDDEPTHRGAPEAAEPRGGRRSRRRGKDAAPVADQPTEEAAPRQRRGLLRRRRAAPAPEPVEPPTDKLDVPTQRGGQARPEPPLKPRDEEYVDWVSGLSSPDPDPRDRR